LSPSGQRPTWYLEEPPSDAGSCKYANINTTSTTDGLVYSENMHSGKFFGSHVGPAYGVLIHFRLDSGVNPTACTAPLITYSTPDRKLPVSEPWIALIKKGECAFGFKEMDAIHSNASAVIVYNDQGASNLDKMRTESEFSEYPYFVTMLSIFSIMYSIRTVVNTHSSFTFFLLNRDKM
jgi:hypothetical protein